MFGQDSSRRHPAPPLLSGVYFPEPAFSLRSSSANHNFAGESPGVPARLAQSQAREVAVPRKEDSFTIVFGRQRVPSPNSQKLARAVSDSHLSVCIKRL
ncbi:hypothetical protein TNCT_218961 [Trichonephila clavata]|uniref:Uncharacterized protein n=2 Tax=Trichonephila TaxID=2585208 RepID=A0A8X6GTU6_TRICU|nr:hypothetical protein TNCT_218961 [Trichonephila clavata]GFY50773.1 hypothetical protein TNIN_242961 [Trichonephila inaurata madagascariensis]